MNAPAIANQQKDGFAEAFGRFFIELQSIFPAWRQALPTTEHLNAAKRQWFKAFQEAGIGSSQQIAAGLRRARAEGTDFWPTPAKFIAWCKPTLADLGLPTIEQAFREAIDNAGRIDNRHWSHKAVYHAALQVGLGDLAVMSGESARKAFEHAYGVTVKAVMAGEQLPDVPRAIERAEPVKARPEVANAHLAAMRAMLGNGKAAQQAKQEDAA